MVDYSESKGFNTKAYPVQANETSNLFGVVEPVMTADKLVSRYLKKIDLKEYSEDDLKDEISLAMNEFELMTDLSIYKRQYKERKAFDRSLYHNFVFTKTDHGPILTVEDMSIVSSDEQNIFKIPPAWLEIGRSFAKQINLIPLLAIMGGTTMEQSTANSGGLIFISAVSNFAWMPAFFTIEYTSGISHTEGEVPVIVNDIIGMTAAMNILGAKQAQNKYNSTSYSQDGISQSASGPGSQVYQPRIDQLTERRERLLKQIKAKTFNKYFLSNI